MTKDEKNKNVYTFDEDTIEAEEGEDVDNLRDDLESTKQLLELEIRSKKLLEKDNKRLQAEVEKMRQDITKLMKVGDQPGAAASGSDASSARRSSVASAQRQSMIRLISESESSSHVPGVIANSNTAANGDETLPEEVEPEEEQPVASPVPMTTVAPEQQEIIESMKEEVDEARKLAEEWEVKYKEMQRQMADLDMVRRTDVAVDGKRVSVTASDMPPSLQRMVSTASANDGDVFAEDRDEEGWMQKREIHMLNSKLKNLCDKREVVYRERKLLTDRVDAIVKNIGDEVEARKRLRKDIHEMNEGFKEELADMEAEERTARELEECYFSDEEDLVVNKTNRKKSTASSESDEDDTTADDDEDVEETLDDILKLAEEDDGEEDPGHHLFEHYPESEDEEVGEEEEDYDKQIDRLNAKLEKHGDYLQTMRKSNFMLKSKIDRLFDILQMQREKHHDLQQELTRMLADIQ